MLNQDSLTRDLTRLAESGELEPAYQREGEILSILEVLARHKAKNALLVGHSGVGKNRIVEGLAVSGVRGETEGLLENFRMLELDLGILSSGAANWEKKLLDLIKYLRQTRDIILFIDNVHAIFEPGSTVAGAMDFKGSLRPALARGDFSCVAATTPANYQKLLTIDPLTMRNFEVLYIEPMTEAATYEVLSKLKPGIEDHHRLRIGDQALHAAVTLTEQFLLDQYLPGKAIEVLDQACARYRYKTVARKTNPNLVDDKSMVMIAEEVSAHDVRKVVQRLSAASLQKLDTQDRWKGVAKRLSAEVIGQEFAAKKVVEALRRASESLRGTHRPDAIMLFLGPRGVGKKYMAERLSAELHGDPANLLVFDMTMFTAELFMNRLLGIPDSENGSDGALVDARPKTMDRVLVFDQIEQAESSCFDILAPALERGRVTDAHGREVMIKNATIIFTSTAESEFLPPSESQLNYNEWLVGLRQIFRPQFFNLVDVVVPFFPLEPGHVREIIRLPINELRRKLASRDISITMHQSAYDYLAAKGFSEERGATKLREKVERRVIVPLKHILKTKNLKRGSTIHVRVEEGRIAFRAGRPKSEVRRLENTNDAPTPPEDD